MNFPIFAGHMACAQPADRTRPMNPRGPPDMVTAELESLRSTISQMTVQVKQAVLQRGGEISAHPTVVDAELALHEQRQREFAERISKIREEEAGLTLRLRQTQLADKVSYDALFVPVVDLSPPSVEKKVQLDVSHEPCAPISVEEKPPILGQKVTRKKRIVPACAMKTTAASRLRASKVRRIAAKSKSKSQVEK